MQNERNQTEQPIPAADEPSAEKQENTLPDDSQQESSQQDESQQENEQPENKKKQRSPMGPIQTFFLNALLIVTAAWLLCGFVFGFATVPNGDMTPNLKSGDLLIYYQLNRSFAAQDVVVLKKNDTVYVGRVVAKGGDTVDITDSGSLVINGNTMIESNIYAQTVRYSIPMLRSTAATTAASISKRIDLQAKWSAGDFPADRFSFIRDTGSHLHAQPGQAFR